MKERIVGLDILRIISMFGIVMVHILGAGGILDCAKESHCYYYNYFFEIIFYSSVNIFAILSGFLSINSKKTYKRTIELICIILFYCVTYTAIFIIVEPSKYLNIKNIIISLFPCFFGKYWYISCFIPLLLLEPIINKVLSSLTINAFNRLLVIAICVFSIIPSLINKDIFGFNDGYSFSWLLFCYIIGNYMRRTDFELFRNKHKIIVILYVLVPFILLFGNLVIDSIIDGYHSYMVSYISPIILYFSVVSVFVFSKIKIQTKINGIVSNIALLSFDVYASHCHILIFGYVITNSFTWIVNLPYIIQPLVAIICGIVIYFLGTVLGKLRLLFFNIIKINTIFEKVEKILVFKIDRE